MDLTTFPEQGGYRVIFDGKTLTGWRGYGKDYAPSKWKAEDGMLHLDSRMPGGEGGDLIFAHRFGDFDLELEWKIAKRGNSGIFYFGREVATRTEGRLTIAPLYYSSLEYQLFDNASYPDDDPKYLSASLYDLIAAEPQNAKPCGEWNRARIRVRRGKVVHEQNGRVVVAFRLWNSAWTEMLKNSKFGPGERPLAFALLDECGGERHEGYIGLQDHGDDVWFRNIRIRTFD